MSSATPSDASPNGSRLRRVLRAALKALLVLWVAVGYGSVAGWIALPIVDIVRLSGAPFVFGGLVFLGIVAYGIRRRARHFRGAFEFLTLVVLIAWGLFVNHILDACASGCGESLRQYLAEPDVYALLVLHGFTVLAYAVSRRRPEPLHGLNEVLIHGLLIVGLVLHGLVAVQFVDALATGLLLPFAMPVFAPLITLGLYGVELVSRLRRRGAEQPPPPPPPPDPLPTSVEVYRVPFEPPRQAPVRPHIHRRLLAQALAASPVLAGVYIVAMRLQGGDWRAAARVFSNTCGHALSGLPVPPPQDCHYLCTVAARGHTAIVRPERLGRRGGRVIGVNRQLAVANAFEDLLHTRWPKFGRMARRVYDRVGLPLSRVIVTRWMADVTYLLMKPAEWFFYLALLLLDRTPPEARIERMYR